MTRLALALLLAGCGSADVLRIGEEYPPARTTGRSRSIPGSVRSRS
jgi:hypothetical protein